MTRKPRPGTTIWARLRLLPLWQRALLTLLVLPPVLAGGTAAAYYLRLHQTSGSVSISELPLFASPEKSKRYLIIAPHCDDETLAVGGFIADAIRKGASVTVAFLTNGDGFPAAATRELKEVQVSPIDYVRFAEIRQQEANYALETLGVKKENIYFLGYPDRGLRPMWENNWSPATPYRSFYTGHTHSPYPVCFSPHTEYNGASLQKDLVRLMNTVQPTDIFVTHPADDHPDHSAAATFAQSALRVCTAEQHNLWTTSAKLHYYIVHRGDWPLPQGKRPDANLSPPPGLVTTDTAWKAYLLSDSTRTTKDRALARYRSQLNISRRFLTSFIRENELFGEMNAPTVPLHSEGWTTVAVDGRRDDVVRYVDPAADLTAIAVRRITPNTLTVRLSVRGKVVPERLRYTLLLRHENTVETLYLSATQEHGAHSLEATIPLATSTDPYLWVAAETRYQAAANLPVRPVDRIGYRPFLLPETFPIRQVSETIKSGKTPVQTR